MKEYIVHTTTYGGTEYTFCFTNKRTAKSYAWHWINGQKQICRDNGHKEYGELKAYITVYTGNEYSSQDVVAYYD